MENEFKAKHTFKLTPCGAPDPCFDYDVCESDDDITDKDLADLLKEETDKLQDESDKDLEENKESNQKTKSKADEYQRTKKRPCKKVVKNPFFTNRLTFSSDMPPRPPIPPPQFFPLAEENEAKVCSKKKKCKKKGGAKTEEEEARADEEEEEEEDGKNQNGCEKTCPLDEVCECPEKPERDRRRCKKDSIKGPCRKQSDISIPPQPRRIPALLKDLPLTCPKDIPEVERQIWMSRDNSLERTERNSCKKKCKKREQIEKLL